MFACVCSCWRACVLTCIYIIRIFPHIYIACGIEAMEYHMSKSLPRKGKGGRGHHAATHRNALQHTATHCNTLQHTATHCNTLQLLHTAQCTELQHSATHTNTAAYYLFPAPHTRSLTHTLLLCIRKIQTYIHIYVYMSNTWITYIHVYMGQYSSIQTARVVVVICTAHFAPHTLVCRVIQTQLGKVTAIPTLCNTLKHTATYYTATYYTATGAAGAADGKPCKTGHAHLALWLLCRLLIWGKCVAVCCSVLQCVAMCCCSVLQCVAVCCSVWHESWMYLVLFFYSLNRGILSFALQHSATQCNEVQHAATHCNNSSDIHVIHMETLCHSHCNTAQHIATHCNTLQHAATHCNNSSDIHVIHMEALCHLHYNTVLLQYVAMCCSMLQCAVAVRCSVLQCVGVCWSVLYCVVVCCSMLQCVVVCCCSVLQCVAVCCSVLQCVAVC